MGTAARRPRLVGGLVALLAVAGAVLALRLEPTTATGTLVERGSPTWQATEDLHRRFGDDAIYVLVREKVSDLVLTADLGRLLLLEGCLSGNRPAGAKVAGGARGPCGRLAATKPVQVVFGPGTFLNTAVGQIQDQFTAQTQQRTAQAERAATAARGLALRQGRSRAEADRLARDASQLVYTQALQAIAKLAAQYGLSGVPSLDDTSFIAHVVFASSGAPGTPKARFAYLFPNRDSALVQVRLRPGLSTADRAQALADVRAAVAMPQWHLAKGRYTVTGAPVVLQDLTTSISRSLVSLLVAALVVMAVVLGLVFRARRRLVPLVVALAAAALTFGAISVAGASLTMASIAVLPVLIGLAVDYAVQLQARVEEERRAGPEPGGHAAAVDRAARHGAPTVATAAAATAAGFLVLALSPLPMVRGFGILLVAGIGLALTCALTLGVAALTPRTPRSAGAARRRGLPPALARAGAAVAASARGAAELLTQHRPARALHAAGAGATARVLRTAVRRPGVVLAAAAALAVVGWGLDTQTKVESDVTKLVPQRLGALRDLQQLQRSTGVGGQVDVLVQGRDLADPDVVAWMARYQRDVLRSVGYDAGRGCGRAALCPAFSLPDLFSSRPASRRQVTGLLDAVPPYFSQGVISEDRRAATLSFGLRLMPIADQQRVLDGLRSRLHPPPGVRARLAGLPVLVAEANDAISSPWRRVATLLGSLLAVAVVLLVAFRHWRRAAIPLVPIALATGWSALVLFALRIPLNPLSVTLGALVVAISTEFSVLLSERFRTERRAGRTTEAALAATYASTGRAVLASGVTAIAGFAVLVVSDIAMLRDFGFVTVVDLGVSLLGVLVVLPAVLVLAERRAARSGRGGPPGSPPAGPRDARPERRVRVAS